MPNRKPSLFVGLASILANIHTPLDNPIPMEATCQIEMEYHQTETEIFLGYPPKMEEFQVYYESCGGFDVRTSACSWSRRSPRKSRGLVCSGEQLHPDRLTVPETDLSLPQCRDDLLRRVSFPAHS